MNNNDHFREYCAVYLFLIDGDKILLARRHNTGWRDEEYGLPAGHIEENEKIYDATIREAKEEIGVDIAVSDLKVVHIMHRLSPTNPYIDFYLVADKWRGEPRNLEPWNCSDIRWFDIHALPDTIIDYVKRAFENYQKGVFFSEE